MAGEPTEEEGRWRQQSQPESTTGNTRARKWSTAALLALSLLAVGALALYLILSIFVRTGPTAYLSPVWTSQFQRAQLGPIPWIEADRKALEAGGYFGEVADGGFRDRTLEQVKIQLDALKGRAKGDAVVVYVATYGLVDGNGAIRICAADSDPSDPDTMLSLQELLQSIKGCPATRKLLVLDISKPAPTAVDPGALTTVEGVADLLQDELARNNDSALRVITTASPGQFAFGSDVLGRSSFNQLFCKALDEPVADTDASGWVDVSELTNYLQTATDRWALHNKGAHQQPFVVGNGPDFPLIALNRPKPKLPDVKSATAAKAEVKAVVAADPSKPVDPTTKAASVEESPAYPTWLSEAWEKRAAWWKDRSIVFAPRALRMYDAVLLRAERDWRGGGDLARLKSDFERGVNAVETERSRTLDVPRPPIRSIGQARAFDWPGHGKSTKDLVDLLNVRRKQPTPEALETAVKAYLDTLKGKTGLDLADAIDQATGDARWNPDFVKFVDSLVERAKAADPAFKRDVVELRFLERLAKRAAKMSSADDWSDNSAKTAWQVVTLAEELDSCADSLPWIGKELDKADALRLDAEVLILPETTGIASWKRIDDAWATARNAYQRLLDQERSLESARISLARSRLVLAAYPAYFDKVDRADLEAAWLETADASRTLDALMTPPKAESEPASFDKISQATADLNRLVQELINPFEPSSIATAANAANDASPDPMAVGRLSAILSTPFVTAKDRVAIWEALRTLERRLAAQPSEEPVEIADGTPDSARLADTQDDTKRKGRILLGLLKLAGLDSPSTTATFPALNALLSDLPPASAKPEMPPRSDLSILWGKLSAAETEVRSALEVLSKQKDPSDDRTVVFAPVYGSDVYSSPSLAVRESQNRAAWTRLASRYLHERTDLNDPDQFYEGAALECIRVGGAPSTGDLEVAMGPEAAVANLSAAKPVANLKARLTWHTGPAETDKTKPVKLALVAPDDPRLSVALETSNLDLNAETPVDIPLKVGWVDEPADGPRKYGPPPIGFLLKVSRNDGRSEYLLMPVFITAESERLRLLLSDSATEVNPLAFDLKLRTLSGRQKLFLHVKNPTAAARNLVVRVISTTGTGIDASETVLNEAKVTAVASRTTPVNAFTAPAIKPADPLGLVPPGLKIRLVDADKNVVLDEAALKPSIAPPLGYIRILKSRFEPTANGEPNRLVVTLRALPDLNGPPCPVVLDVSRDAELFPSLLAPPKGRLVGEIEPASELTVYAQDLSLDPSSPQNGTFPIDLDNQKRALWFTAKFPLQGGPQQAQIDTKPRIRFKASPNVKADQPARLDVDFLVDNAPSKATIEFRLGHVEGGTLIDDITPWVNTAKQSRIGFDSRGEAGALLLEAALGDWSPSLLTAGIRGERTLQARLIDADGRTVLDSSQKTMILDDLKPQDVALGPVSSKIPKGTATIPVSAVALMPASSVKDMTFFLGKSADFDKALAAGATAKGKPASGDPATWTADLPIPDTAVNPLFVSVRVTSGVDLISFATEETELVPPLPTPDEEKAKKEAEASKPGTISGKVAQGSLPQPNLTVSLLELNVKAGTDPKTAEAKTDKAGLYTFKDLKPGKYRVVCRNNASLTKSIKEVAVDPGKTATQDLDLLR